MLAPVRTETLARGPGPGLSLGLLAVHLTLHAQFGDRTKHVVLISDVLHQRRRLMRPRSGLVLADGSGRLLRGQTQVQTVTKARFSEGLWRPSLHVVRTLLICMSIYFSTHQSHLSACLPCSSALLATLVVFLDSFPEKYLQIKTVSGAPQPLLPPPPPPPPLLPRELTTSQRRGHGHSDESVACERRAG